MECFILQRQMRRLIFCILFLLPIGVFSFCKKNWKQTPSGIYYKIFTNDTSKEKPVYGDHIWMHLRKISPKQKEIFNTRVFNIKDGVEMDYKKPLKLIDVTEIFAFMGKGDSAKVRIPSSELDSNGSAKKYYTFWLNLIDFKSKSDFELAKKMHYQQQSILDSLTIIDFIKNKKLQDCREDENGNWYVRQYFGTGKRVQEGDSVYIHYKGKLTNGIEFDNSNSRQQPLQFVVGKKQVIDGLDKGIQHFYIGDNGLLIIPSRLAYGDKEVGKIPANSVLVFEIEVLK